MLVGFLMATTRVNVFEEWMTRQKDVSFCIFFLLRQKWFKFGFSDLPDNPIERSFVTRYFDLENKSDHWRRCSTSGNKENVKALIVGGGGKYPLFGILTS
jgi:hypothetical protein